MADKKISALTGATTPLAGTEVLPIVQGGATVKVAVSDLTAGRAISATQLTLTTGSVIVANGQGIDFSATPGTGTSELLADYEEGTWTPVYYGSTGSIGSLAYDTQAGSYTKVGRLVTATCAIRLTNKGSWTGNVQISGLPYAIGTGEIFASMSTDFVTYTGQTFIYTYTGQTFLFVKNVSTAAANAGITTVGVANNSGFFFTFTYYV